jgi:hypothetical protein
MEWTIDYLEEDGIVRVKTSGIATWDDSRKLSEEAIECGRRNGSSRFLLDNRNLERTLATLQVDMLPSMLKQAGMTAEDKMSLVYESSSLLKDTHKFFRDVAYLASLQVRLFTETDEAVAWLKSNGPDKP